MTVWMKTRVGQRNYVWAGLQIHQRKGAIFRGCPGHSKAVAIIGAAIAAAFYAKGIIQLPITSRSRRDRSLCQASVNRNPENPGRKECGLSTTEVVMGVHSSVGEV